jgi:acetyl esterase/lipase
MKRAALICIGVLCCSALAGFGKPPEQILLWPDKAPGETKELPPEADMTKPTDGLVAGKRVARIGNVSTPLLEIHRPPADKDTGAAVMICPGGGHYILAWDLEGTEVADWLNGLGVTALVLKYRVPARDPDRRWVAAVQDAQRGMSIARSRATDWNIDANRIGILGFSAGGETATLTACFGDERQYEPIDDVDKTSAVSNFAILIYPAYLTNKESTALRPELKVTKATPPMFFAHAQNDPVTPASSLLMALALKQAGVPAELHLYSTGGHGFGLRKTDDACTTWSQRCEEWLKSSGWLTSKQ